LDILRNNSNPATARATAARTLAEYFGDEAGAGGHKRAEEMTAEEIDAEIASIQQRSK
jgi:hypothetical protein